MDLSKVSSNIAKVNFKDIISKYDHIFFDCDGVIWDGVKLYEDAFATMKQLKEMNKNIYFITNATLSSRQGIKDRVAKGGFEAELDKIYTASYLAARYVKLQHPNTKKAYILAAGNMGDEFKQLGIEPVPSSIHDGLEMDREKFDSIEVDEEIGALVTGLDYKINFYKLCYASILAQRGAAFVVSYRDPCCKTDKYMMPVGGSIAASIEYSSMREGVLVGKPNTTVFEIAHEQWKFDKSKCLMIGDNLDTDIKMANDAKIDSLLVMTGVTKEPLLQQVLEGKTIPKPTYYADDLQM